MRHRDIRTQRLVRDQVKHMAQLSDESQTFDPEDWPDHVPLPAGRTEDDGPESYVDPFSGWDTGEPKTSIGPTNI